MSISFDAKRRLFRLDTANMTYAFAVSASGLLCHLWFGGHLPGDNDLDAELETLSERKDTEGVSREITVRQEYAAQEPFDFMQSALLPVFPDGTRGARLRYVSHDIQENALSVLLRDAVYPLRVTLEYELLEPFDLIRRKAMIETDGPMPIRLAHCYSASLELPAGDYRVTHYSGHWGAEYRRNRGMLGQEKLVLENGRGLCSAHQHVPFIALDEGGTAAEETGNVWFGALEWSGEMKITAERDFFRHVRVTAGVRDEDFTWTLTKEHPFETPGFVLGYTERGFSGMSKALYDWQWDRLLPRKRAGKPFPIIYNSWYPYEFSVDEEKCLALLPKIKAAGAELFVLDDGWMEGRTDDRKGLGDWHADEKRFPHGLKAVADACHESGLLFGLWVEPEMVNPESRLYAEHPEWVLRDEKRPLTTMRRQLVLDLSLPEVRRFCIETLDRLIEENKLDYLKWDMNRYVSERGTDAEMPVSYIRALYGIWRYIREKYPHLLLENCASGGGRADFGMSPYADRVNRSDNADPVDVIRLHEGFTTLYPPMLAGGAGNISPCPNRVNGREAPFAFRALCGMTGSMSIGIDLMNCTEEEIAEIKEATERYKKHRDDIAQSYVLRLKSAEEGNVSAWEYLRRDGETAIVFLMGHGLRYEEGAFTLRLRGLSENALYRDEEGNALSGGALMRKGIPIRLRGDYDSGMLVFRKEKTVCTDLKGSEG